MEKLAAGSRYAELRSLALAILKTCYAEARTSEELRTFCLRKLVAGLGDPSGDIRAWVWEYFMALESMPKGSFDRLKHVLKHLYFPENENILVSQAVLWILTVFS